MDHACMQRPGWAPQPVLSPMNSPGPRMHVAPTLRLSCTHSTYPTRPHKGPSRPGQAGSGPMQVPHAAQFWTGRSRFHVLLIQHAGKLGGLSPIQPMKARWIIFQRDVPQPSRKTELSPCFYCPIIYMKNRLMMALPSSKINKTSRKKKRQDHLLRASFLEMLSSHSSSLKRMGVTRTQHLFSLDHSIQLISSCGPEGHRAGLLPGLVPDYPHLLLAEQSWSGIHSTQHTGLDPEYALHAHTGQVQCPQAAQQIRSWSSTDDTFGTMP